ncbi:MAG: PqqD family protein [Proteobacteria bacterium]|nr:PqqD family protein [Pseudomonadota bacterium]
MGKLSLSDTYFPAANAAFRRIGDDIVIVDTAHNQMMTLNRTGTEIWALLDGHSVDEIAVALVELFDIERNQAVADVTDFIQELERRNLVASKTS